MCSSITKMNTADISQNSSIKFFYITTFTTIALNFTLRIKKTSFTLSTKKSKEENI